MESRRVMIISQVLPVLRYYLSNRIFVQRLLVIRQYFSSHTYAKGSIDTDFTMSASRILVIDPTMPAPDRDAGSRHIWDILQFLTTRGFSVWFVPANLSVREPYKSQLQGIGVNVLSFPQIWSVSRYLRRYQSHFDAIILSRYPVAWKYMQQAVLAKLPGQQIIFNTEDLQHLRLSREAVTTGNNLLRRYATRVMHHELQLTSQADHTLVVSEVEQNMLNDTFPTKDITLLPLTISVVEKIPPWRIRNGIFFVGGFRHYPNVDGLHYFLREVWPIIRRLSDTITLRVVGTPIPHFKDVSLHGVVFLGNVKSMEPLLETTRISIAPLRFGAGLKGKVLESLSYGVPVVGTPVAAEGFEPINESGIIIADTSEDMAHSIVRLYRDEELWNRHSEQSLRYVRSHFSDAIHDDLSRVVRPEKRKTPGAK